MDIKGHTVHRVWIEAASDIAKEYYASVTFDRGEKKPLVMLSAMGGVDIEEVAAEHPDELARLHIDPPHGLPAAPRALAAATRPGSTTRRHEGRHRHPAPALRRASSTSTRR